MDPTTRRGVTLAAVAVFLLGFGLGYVVTFLAVGLASGDWEAAFHSGFAGALVASVLLTLLYLEREDGRIARRVATYTEERRPPDETA